MFFSGVTPLDDEPEQLDPALASVLGETTFEDFVNMDRDEPTSCDGTDESLPKEMSQPENAEDADESDMEEESNWDECDTPIDTATALKYIAELIKFDVNRGSDAIVSSA